MKDEIRKRFVAYQDEIMEDLGKMIAIDSERGETKEGAPFGENPLKALKTYLAIGERMGFDTDNVDNYAGSVEYGKGKEESVGILAHVDVVPAGEGWATDPFKLTIKDNVMYGRGVIDDKGPAIAALYGMRILRDMGLPLKRSIRIITGSNEEQGSACLKYYTKHRPQPTFGFTPDAEYPCIHGEKGNLWAWLSFPQEDTPILSMKAGEAPNAVPSKCVVILKAGVELDEAELKRIATGEITGGYPYEVEKLADGTTRLTVFGKAAHGSLPHLGWNAVVTTAELLCGLYGEKAGKLLHCVRDVFGRENNGKTYGVYFEDEPSGGLTLNVGIADIDAENNRFTIDIRFPVTGKLDDVKAAVKAGIEKVGGSAEIINSANPLYVPKDSELVQTLLKVYRDVTGEKDADAFVIGGGTYAKEVDTPCVAFGPEFDHGVSYNMHDVDECFPLDEFMDFAVICTMAMYELAK